jgi:hypothetical protein
MSPDIKPANTAIDQQKGEDLRLRSCRPLEFQPTALNPAPQTSHGWVTMGATTPTHMLPEQFTDAVSCDELVISTPCVVLTRWPRRLLPFRSVSENESPENEPSADMYTSI